MMAVLQGRSSVSRSHHASLMDLLDAKIESCSSLPLHRARVLVEVEGQGYQRVFFTQPYQIYPLEMVPGNAQPYEKKGNEAAPPEQVYPGKAIRIRSSAPIVVYGVTRFCYTSDSFLAYPIRVLGKEYIVSSMADMTWMYPGYNLPSETVIAAPYDNTKVTVTIGGNAMTETSGGLRPGQTRTWTLNRNDVLAIATGNNFREGDLSGTLIRASKPVAVLSGNQCANVPTDLRWCDFIDDMEIPTDMWGKVYLVPRVPTAPLCANGENLCQGATNAGLP